MTQMQIDRLHEFITTVKDMRDAQKTYFKTRDREVMRKSILLESKVDGMVDGMIDILGDAGTNQSESHA